MEAATSEMHSDAPAALIEVCIDLVSYICSFIGSRLSLGLPAFKPGEKVEIDFGMDDI